MDNRLIVAIRETKGLTVSQKAILWALASRGDKAYPNQSQLMKDSGIGSRNTLIKNIKQLEALGWLTITKGKWSTNQYKNIRYKVHVPNMTNPCIKTDEPLVNIDTLKINKDKHKDKHNKKTKEKISWNVSNLTSLEVLGSHSDHI